jgi:two-component system OmpR family sensor kinase
VSERLEPGRSATRAAPDLPKLDPATVRARAGHPFTAPAKGRGHDWRVLVSPVPDGSGQVVTVAVSQDDVDDTVGQLTVIELAVSAAVLAMLAALGYLVVRSSLRRLVEVEVTAEAIAAGDLSRRVPAGDDRTEVGRLATALNTMLAQIETAFRAREVSEAGARASEERMRRFVADASHELRTPLTSIRGFAELHRQGAVPDPAAVTRVMRRIEAEAARMGLLVDDLLLLARLDQQRPLERRPVDLLAVATDAVGDARAVAPEHRVSLEVSGGPDAPPPVVTGDEARLRQVVGNLMTNAFTHTPPGTSVTVHLRTDATTARLSVADNGPGLAPEHAERVFERFYRVDSSRGRAHADGGGAGGSGLGLSIVAALVAAHGGRVGVWSEPGTGTRFDLDLPLAAADVHPGP